MTDTANLVVDRHCPRDRNIICHLPGPIDGCCCKVIPDRPVGFGVVYRNPGHWDITTRWGRAFRIRGELGNVVVADEREDPKRPHPREWIKFKTVTAALSWCADELMHPQSAVISQHKNGAPQ